MKNYYVYIMASRKHGTLYVGVTSHLLRRADQHARGLLEGFTKTHAVKMLVWYEMTQNIEGAIRREKQLKAWKRGWKIRLIESDNPEWSDLAIGLR